MPAPHLERGEIGEHLVAERLEARGHRVLERRWRGTGGEIDLITIRDGILHIVEVKTRTGDQLGGAEQSITASKRARIARTAEAYLAVAPPFDGVVFDVALVAPAADGGAIIEYIEDAFDSPR